LRQLSARLETTKNQLETLRKIKDSEDHGNTREASLSRGFELEKRQLQADLKQLEVQFSHLENLKRGVERENQRLQANLSVKDQDIQVFSRIFLTTSLSRTVLRVTLLGIFCQEVFLSRMYGSKGSLKFMAQM
jgi:hypothetical protein